MTNGQVCGEVDDFVDLEAVTNALQHGFGGLVGFVFAFPA